MRIIEEEQLDFCDVLIQPKRSNLNSRKEVNIEREFKWTDRYGIPHNFFAIPVCAANMGTTGTFKMAEELTKNGYMCALEKHYSVKEISKFYKKLEKLEKKDKVWIGNYRQRVFPTIGVNDDIDALVDFYYREENAEIESDCVQFKKHRPFQGIVIDIANGYMGSLVQKVKEVRSSMYGIFIIVGNVVTADVTSDLIMAGANAVKVGIGSSGVCLTRKMAGVGRPQLSTVIECADAAHQLNAYVMSDGGCTCPADINKALCAGADFVMLGGMLSGCDEADGKLVSKNGRKFKQFYGMSSKYAQNKFFGKFKNYRASEGREKLIPYTGKLVETIEEINGSIRSCCTYIGCHDIRHMSKHASFYKVNRQLNTIFEKCEDFSY